jgi:hypothetical protein
VRAVELRRNSLMAKLDVRSSLELMRFAVLAQHELGLECDFVAASPVDRVLVKAR